MIVGSLFLLVAVVLLARGLATGSVVYLVASVAASLVAVVALVVKARQAGLVRFTGARPDPAAARATHPAAGPDTGPAGPTWVEPDEVLVGEVMERRATPAVVTSPAPHPDPTTGRTAGTASSDGGGAASPSAGTRAPDGPADAGHARRSTPAATAAPVDLAVPVDAEDVVAPPDVPTRASGSVPDGAVVDDEEPQDEAPAERLSPSDLALLATMPDEVHVIDGRPRFHSADCPVLPLYEHESLPVSEAVELGFTPCADCAAGSGLLTRVPG